MSRRDGGAGALETVASIPRDHAGPVFAEPWEAQAFALAVRLNEQGCFTWSEWSEALAAEIATVGPGADGGAYYRHWLAALEKLVTKKSLVSVPELGARKDAWARAARATPHGETIRLRDES